MIDYVKIFEDTINKNFEALATEVREKHPRPYIKQDIATFGLAIENNEKDNLPWVEGQAFAYTCKLADLLQNNKIKSMNITIEYNPDIEGDFYALLKGEIKLEDR